MKTATENLKNDHISILQLIDVMDCIVASSKPVNTEDAENIVDLIKSFADGLHHAKEENLLFPLMVTKGFSTENGPVAVMLNEHETGRNYVRSMIDAIRKINSGEIAEEKALKQSMHSYSELLKAHIQKENNILFNMADKVFSTEEQEETLNAFIKLEKGSDENRPASEFLERINRLLVAYNL